MTSSERAQHQTLKRLDSVARHTLHLPDTVVHQAKQIYTDVHAARLSRGQMHGALVAASVYYACKAVGLARPKLQVVNAFGVCEKSMSAACKEMKALLRDKPYFASMLTSLDTSDHLHRVLSSFGWERDTRIAVTRAVRELDDRLRRSGLFGGKDPASVLAATIFAVCRQQQVGVTKKRIAEECGISMVTLNKYANSLLALATTTR